MHNQLGDELIRLCAGARYLVIAAPYVKADALIKVLSKVSPDAFLICITRWNLQDIVLGASDIESRTIVTKLGGSFRLHPSLHAKYYRLDNVVLVGSANLTSAALGWSRQPNLEILCRAGDDFDADTFQQELLNNAREISDQEFSRWEVVVRANKQSESPIANDQPLLDSWRPATREPRHLELVYRGREKDIASPDEQRAGKQDIQTLLIPPGLTDEQVRAWVSVNLLEASFTNSVIRLQNMEALDASRQLADAYNLRITDARRDMETVHNWLAFFAPETLSEGS